jgi:hypothetical protein
MRLTIYLGVLVHLLAQAQELGFDVVGHIDVMRLGFS